ncbi:MAG: trigger factor [Lachnospiraceae bacterium]|nr:trigger factor [Lachnospiraceae bacterium]
MSVTVENLDKNMAKLTIEVSAEDFEKAIQKAYLKQKSQIAIPGFRKGKVPRQIIEKLYGAQVFFEEAANNAIEEAYPKAAEESELKILTRPEIDVVQIEKGLPFIFTALVAVYPEVELGDYKGIEVPINKIEVTDEEVDADLKREQEKNARVITVDDRPAKMGDTVVLDYKGTIDGVEFEGGSAENHSLVLGSNQFIPGFEVQLVGVNAGEEKDVEVRFPEDYHAEDLKGKDAVFHCTIHRIETKEIPELDDEFAQDVSEFDTFEEYKEDVKKKIVERKEKQAENSRRQAALAKVAKQAKIELPEMLIREHAQKMAEDFANRVQQQGIDINQYLQIMGMTPDAFMNHNYDQAQTELRNSFTLAKIAELENLEATDERVEEELENAAKMYGISVEDYKSYIPENYADDMKADLKLQMALELLGENAVETEAATKEAEEAMKSEAEEAVKAVAEEAAEEPAEAEAEPEEKKEEE